MVGQVDVGAEAPPIDCTLEHHLAEAQALLAPLVAHLRNGPVERVVATAPENVGRVLAERAVASTPIPAFDNSQMDGYAVHSADLETATTTAPVTLPVGAVSAAGAPPIRHRRGSASPVMTGATIPAGADAVVPIELAHPPCFPELVQGEERAADTPREPATVGFTSPVAPGRFVRGRGEDLDAGDTVAETGTRLTSARIGALAAAGVEHVVLQPQPRVLLCSTGDELAAAGDRLRPGRIHDANTPMLWAQLERLGAEVFAIRSHDTPHDFLATLAGTCDGADLVITTGGISVGAFEVVREALAPLGCDFHSVALQPGGPQGLGFIPPEALTHADGTNQRGIPVLCFPGNPVSATLSLELFLAPTLRLLQGLPPRPEPRWLPLAHDIESPAAKHQVRRGALDAAGTVVVSAPGSHLIGELAAAELLVHIPVGVSHVAAGSLVETWRFND